MVEKQTTLATSLRSAIGPDNVSVRPDLVVDGLNPDLLIRPASPREVAECLKICAGSSAAVVPAGYMTWLEGGNPLRRANVILSLERMSRIVDYSPPDLTVTVEPGVTLAQLNAVAGAERQWLPFDPPGGANCSLGAVAACASSGPLRFGFGTPRDYVIGLKLGHIDGTESKSGGKVVKNVAGYDMNKLYVGSFGTLAVLTGLTFKLKPVPDASATVMLRSRKPASLIRVATELFRSGLQPASVFLAAGMAAGDVVVEKGSEALLVRFLDNEPAVAHQVESVKHSLGEDIEASSLSEKQAELVWEWIANIDRTAGVALRLNLPASSARAGFADVRSMYPGSAIAADLGAGSVRLSGDWQEVPAVGVIRQLRESARSVGGTLFIERATSTVRQQADAWGDIGETAGIMESIKRKFDPESLLSPGRFVANI